MLSKTLIFILALLVLPMTMAQDSGAADQYTQDFTVVSLDEQNNTVSPIVLISVIAVVGIALIILITLLVKGKLLKNPKQSKADKRNKLRKKIAALELEIQETNKEIRRIR